MEADRDIEVADHAGPSASSARQSTRPRVHAARISPSQRTLNHFLYVSQVLQAEGIHIGAEHLRRIMPHNMGSLYWQIDDCWPVASWSSIDYYRPLESAAVLRAAVL